jgi:VanZ family protein
MQTSAADSPTAQSVARRLSRYLPLLLWMALISFASTSEFSADNTSRIIGPLLRWLFPTISGESLNTIHSFIRKLGHFTEYALLGLLAARAFITSSRTLLARPWFISSVLLVVVYAFIDEFHQSFVPSRTASVYDSFIDIAGGLTAIVIYWFFNRRREIREAATADYDF